MRCGDVNYRLFGFIARLEKELEKKGWDQRELAKQSGLSDANVRKTFQGALKARALERIADALDIEYSYVFTYAILPKNLADKRKVKRAVRKLKSLFHRNREVGLQMLDEMLDTAE
jgi:transcriptional regulator with XRE-family HTH domain